ncbi:Gfo/Idh/MocA family protein [Fredinandcohnia humi]
MGKIRVGVIGAGTIAEIGHLPYYQQHPDVELVSVVDMNLERARSIANKFGASSAYQTAEEMFENEDIDAVSICTSNVSHIPLAQLAITNGVDVLIEKPIGISYADAQALAKKVAKNNRICMVGMTHRFRNEAIAAKRFIDNGDVGDVYYVKAKILRRRGTPTGWFTDKSIAGGGPLMDIGVHVLDLAWWLVGKPNPETVTGHLVKGIGKYNTEMFSTWNSSQPENRENQIFDVEDFGTALIRFDNGIVLHLEVSWAINGAQDEGLKVEVFGTKGGISLEPLVYYTEMNNIFLESKLAIEKNNPMESEMNHFIESVQTRNQPLIDANDGAKIIGMLEGIYLSSDFKKEINIRKDIFKLNTDLQMDL